MKSTLRPIHLIRVLILGLLASQSGLAKGLYVAGLNYPAGSLPSTLCSLAGILPVQVAPGDANGDGKMDAVAAAGCSSQALPVCQHGSIVAPYLNKGDGTFQVRMFSAGDMPSSLRSSAVRDFMHCFSISRDLLYTYAIGSPIVFACTTSNDLRKPPIDLNLLGGDYCCTRLPGHCETASTCIILSHDLNEQCSFSISMSAC